MTWYGDVIRGEGVEHVARVAFRLIRNGLLDEYLPSKPASMSLDDAAAYLGVLASTLRSFIKRMLRRRKEGKPLVRGGVDIVSLIPVPLDGGSAYKGPFPMAAIEMLYEVRHLVFTRTAKKGFLPSTLRGSDFEGYLQYKVRELLFAPPVPSPFQHPDGIPKDGNELYRKHRRDVLRGIRRVIKFGIDIQDAEQEVWAKLLHSDPITKYVQGAASKRIGKTMTGIEAADFLGLVWETWEEVAPTPLKGEVSDETATYATSDVLPLQEQGLATEPRKLPKSVSDPWKFASYVKSAATRHAINLIRTEERRFVRDRPLNNTEITLSSQGGGVYRASRVEDRNESWETSIASGGPGVDELAEARRTAALLGIQDEDEYLERLGAETRTLRRRGVAPDSDEAVRSFLPSQRFRARFG